MWENVGIIRTDENLEYALGILSDISINKVYLNKDYLSYRNAVQVGRLIAYSALLRKESRGTHYRIDYPNLNKSWEKHINLQKLKI